MAKEIKKSPLAVQFEKLAAELVEPLPAALETLEKDGPFTMGDYFQVAKIRGRISLAKEPGREILRLTLERSINGLIAGWNGREWDGPALDTVNYETPQMR